jgi:hypothetical protein
MTDIVKLSTLLVLFLSAYFLSYRFAKRLLNTKVKKSGLLEFATLAAKVSVSGLTVLLGIVVFDIDGLVVAATAFTAMCLFFFWLSRQKS